MNINNFQILLQKAIDSSNNTTDYLLLSKAVQALGVGQVREVATYANLPAAASNEGLLVFVTADERLYWSTGAAWFNLIDENRGIAYASGAASFGRLGDGTTVAKSSPVSVVGGFTDWRQVSAGHRHTAGIRTNGAVWAWGSNSSGELGDGTTVSKSSPVSTVGGFTNWCQVSGGSDFTLGIRTNGTAWAWGYAGLGRLGDGTTVNKSSPVSVVGGFADWCQVSGGYRHSLGVRTNGSIWSWGYSVRGQLGDGTTVAKSSPVSVVGGFTNWCQVSAGCQHSLGVRTNGTAWAWGYNICGQLGDGTTTNRSSPVSVVGGFTDWCQMSAGNLHSLGVRRNGTAWAWGSNLSGQLGNNTTVSNSSPVSVVGGFTDWCQVAAGGSFNSLGVRTNGTAWAWGNNGNGQAADGTITARSSPVSVIGGFTDWCQVSAGTFHSLVLRKPNFV